MASLNEMLSDLLQRIQSLEIDNGSTVGNLASLHEKRQEAARRIEGIESALAGYARRIADLEKERSPEKVVKDVCKVPTPEDVLAAIGLVYATSYADGFHKRAHQSPANVDARKNLYRCMEQLFNALEARK